ncbi:C-_U-editing enzyme APOBEC-2a [Haplochromis burtoni]|uniref:Apolipoprotein B mRNA editing enzyme, catalytic polypeptide-like 2a n=1 Tax=Haplochromis burtoni TaxID=8153 RepID=A0A3Q3CTY0_HAPBU|nr:C->U-editing enzyme APOBEC-2a [Haplochromis burtoni]
MDEKCQTLVKRRQKEENEVAEIAKDAKEKKNKEQETVDNREVASAEAATTSCHTGDFQLEPMELPPFEIITGDRIDPFIYKFQFKNVEYSSGRNKTLLCYLVDKGNTSDGLLRGYLEDEHAGTHAEEAFFAQCLPHCNPAVKYTVTWYVSSSPCSTCATKIAELLKDRKNLKLNIFAARLFEWEEGEIQAGLRTLHAAGCKLRMMKPLDFSYTWDTFVENEDQPLNLWEDCKENYEYYHERLSDILTP